MDKHLFVECPVAADGTLPAEYTCDGTGRPLPLRWADPPEGTASIAIVLLDRDATHHPVHWIAWNLPADARELRWPGNPPCEQGTNSFGHLGYTAPCPTEDHRPHRIAAHVYAVDKRLDLDDTDTIDELMEALRDHVLARGEVELRYTRRAHEQSIGFPPA